jgi:phosphonopyruvate hydrolase
MKINKKIVIQQQSKLLKVMSAHNPLSAKLAEQAGFDAIWGSGFELSASFAVPDASVLPMSVHLEMMRAIATVISIPLIADIDTGFGNAVNVHYVVPQYEAAGVSAVVMEDKSFPKDTSLRDNARQDLLRIDEFQGKINAAIDARNSKDFLVITRVEALIAGLGLDEAIKRGLAYEEAGADAILIHSKSKTPNEIVAFINAWPGKAPLVLVPTAYPQLNETAIAKTEKVGLVIYGNHAIRGAVWGMRQIFASIRKHGGIEEVDQALPTVNEIIDLQGDRHMRDIESRFLR